MPDQPIVAAITGLLLLLGGGQLVVREAVTLATRLGLSPLFIGVVIVGFGTSAPELATGTQAAFTGAPALAFGNVIGASLANLLIVLPLAALLLPFRVPRAAIRHEAAAVVAAAGLLAGIAVLPLLARAGGFVLLLLLAGWLLISLRQASNAAGTAASARLQEREGQALVISGQPLWRAFLLLVAGIAALLVGAALLVAAATDFAVRMGVGEDVLGLTLLSVGTCLPELATAIVAVRQRQTDIVVGNALGSCLFNLLAVGGTVLAISGTGPAGLARQLDAPMLVLAAATVAAILLVHQGLNRFGALCLMALYAAWLTTRLLM
ncbi:sodium:calcium antiporter [Sandarakinorhabdus sp.]|uniref:sodium:calcium antiporter n=1 Tax=Sandarakinorhabdus sp. TaxID=1916663 RepID=UPI003F6E665B